MSYKENSPQILSVLTRKLKPGKTFEDFQQAHLPPGKAKKTEVGYNVDYFRNPTRVLNAISATDPSIIVSIGLSYGSAESVFEEVTEKMPLEKERARQISQVAEKIGPTQIFFVAADNNFGGESPAHEQQPFTDVTPEIVEAMQAFTPKK